MQHLPLSLPPAAASQKQRMQTQSSQDSDGRVRKSVEFGFANYPAIIREPLIALKMLQKRGIQKTLSHVRVIALLRFLHLIDDRKRMSSIEQVLGEATNAQAGRARVASDVELDSAVHCAPIPATALTWTLSAIDLDLADYHFVDVGSGWGYALAVAGVYPFRHLTGIEFAGEFHDMACANFDNLARNGTIDRDRVTLLHASALETELPPGPLMILLANPFGEAVMRPFLERVADSHRRNPRPITILYVNPKHASLFGRDDVVEIPLKGPSAQLLRWFGPYPVRVFCWHD